MESLNLNSLTPVEETLRKMKQAGAELVACRTDLHNAQEACSKASQRVSNTATVAGIALKRYQLLIRELEKVMGIWDAEIEKAPEFPRVVGGDEV